MFDRLFKKPSSSAPLKLHLGCGPNAMPGWVNMDNQPYPGVDRIVDLAKGIPYDGAAFIFAEHFIEHLDFRDALALMRECRRALNDDGVLRLSTPNLDWVWATHYRLDGDARQTLQDCFYLNRAFRGWGHQFLYNETTLRATLQLAGFSTIVRCAYGESAHEELRGLEKHEKSPDTPERSHILIVEASGRGTSHPESMDPPMSEFLRDVEVK
ncbi:MAG: class I SAM-dependent methyltransferase [Thermoanaerobaculia bacterium]